jgi:DNA-binding CsgD family transcriptional regulator
MNGRSRLPFSKSRIYFAIPVKRPADPDARAEMQVGELAYWRWKVGDLNEPPAEAAKPFALQILGGWEEAAEEWRRLDCPYEAARALAESDDEAALRQALEAFERLGARPATQEVAQRLRELGAKGIPRGPRPSTLANPAGLTRRELEVLALLAEGRSNADIAAELFRSPKTVEHHVSAILAKLGASNRTEAVREAILLGVLDDQNRELQEPN